MTDASPPGFEPRPAADEWSMPVVVEEPTITTHLIDTGRGVRLHKQVHVERVRIDQPLERHTVDIERVAIGRPVDGPVAVRHDGDTMIVPVVEERLVWSIQHVLVEEIRVTRRTTVEHATEDVALRREEVHVERFDESK